MSGHPLDAYKGLIHAIDSFEKLDEINSSSEREPFRLVGVISNVNTIIPKSKKKMATFILNKRKKIIG